MSTYVLTLRTPADGPKTQFASVLSREQIDRRSGLREEAIMGRSKDPAQPLTPENFVQNRTFVRFLHDVISEHASRCPALMAEAKRVHDGFVYVLDGRSPPGSAQPAPEDVIGVITVKDGALTQYRPSPNYAVLSHKGFMILEGWLHARLIESLLELPVGKITLEPDPG